MTNHRHRSDATSFSRIYVVADQRKGSSPQANSSSALDDTSADHAGH